MARIQRIRTTKTENEPTDTLEEKTKISEYDTWKLEQEKIKAFAKSRGIEVYHVFFCKTCNEMLEYKELKPHRRDVHDTPRGITQHTRYYSGALHGSSQIVLIDPYGLSVQEMNADRATGFGGIDWNETHVKISANDQDIDNYSREVTLYLSIDETKRLIAELQKVVDNHV